MKFIVLVFLFALLSLISSKLRKSKRIFTKKEEDPSGNPMPEQYHTGPRHAHGSHSQNYQKYKEINQSLALNHKYKDTTPQLKKTILGN